MDLLRGLSESLRQAVKYRKTEPFDYFPSENSCFRNIKFNVEIGRIAYKCFFFVCEPKLGLIVGQKFT